MPYSYVVLPPQPVCIRCAWLYDTRHAQNNVLVSSECSQKLRQFFKHSMRTGTCSTCKAFRRTTDLFPGHQEHSRSIFCSWSILGMRESNAGELRTVFYKCACCRPGYASALHPVKMKVTEHVVLTRKEVHFTTLCGAGLSLGRIATAVWKHKVHLSSL